MTTTARFSSFLRGLRRAKRDMTDNHHVFAIQPLGSFFFVLPLKRLDCTKKSLVEPLFAKERHLTSAAGASLKQGFFVREILRQRENLLIDERIIER